MVSTIWTTPFVAKPSENKTFALPSEDWIDNNPLFDFVIVIGSLPKLNISELPSGKSAALRTHPDITCLLRSFLKLLLFSGLNKLSNVPGDSFSKASLSGAKTVNLSTLSKVSSRSAAWRASTRIERLGVLMADTVIVSNPPGIGGCGWLISFDPENDEVCSILFVSGGTVCVSCWNVWKEAPDCWKFWGPKTCAPGCVNCWNVWTKLQENQSWID